ncbi:unnamed protein product [Rotaria sp. Silwood2]|nr:unnamed protein product [Rotaria sp. Silwood2]CAF3289563.1 unnamed protein product [Rotaria sp. Silwood2]CAF4536798.1 unnamed protein product [Rotaria sp. Silwood2]
MLCIIEVKVPTPIKDNCRPMLRKINTQLLVAFFTVFLVTWHFSVVRLPSCSEQSSVALQAPESENVAFEQWKIPNWVERFNVTHLFDWTWHKNGEFIRCRAHINRSSHLSACKAASATVVNDVLDYFRSHPDEGCIVDNVIRLPNLIPHPLPLARSLTDTCSSLHINHEWAICIQPQSELNNLLPATKRFVTIAVFNAFVDTGYCHPQVPGTVFTERATFHLQRWTNKRCSNDVISNIPQIKNEYRHTELIDSIGNYLEAPGHFAPQQLPRLLRLLATAPTTAKVLVAKGGVADSLIDVLIERGIVTRDRIIQFDKDIRPNHFANIVYRSESWPYVGDKGNSHYIHDRTDMQLVHRAMATDDLAAIDKKDCIIVIKRKDGDARSIVEHSDMIAFITSALNKSKVLSDRHIEIFEAQGHIRDHIALFRRARIIVGPHGAGMMNILWSSPGTHVIEIGYTTGMTFPEMYAEMSLHLEHHYWICKGHGDYYAPIHVDMEDFMYIFNQIIHEIEIEEGRS